MVNYPKQGYSFQNLLQSVLSDVVSVDGSQDKTLFGGDKKFPPDLRWSIELGGGGGDP